MTHRGIRFLTVLVALGAPVGLALLPSRAVRAQVEEPMVFLALAAGSQQTPSVDTPGVAFGRFVLSADGSQLTYAIRVSGLNGTPTAVNVHRGRPGVSGEAVYELAAPAEGRSAGVLAFNAEDEADLAGQGLYLNIKTDLHPDGEIRGQLLPSPDTAIGEEQEQPAAEGVSFSKEVQPIFAANCSCHTSASPMGGLSLASEQAYTGLVDVTSDQSALDLIEPGDPAKSYLLHKLNNTQRTVGGSGVRMPQGRARLPAEQIATITTWIEQGAKNN